MAQLPAAVTGTKFLLVFAWRLQDVRLIGAFAQGHITQKKSSAVHLGDSELFAKSVAQFLLPRPGQPPLSKEGIMAAMKV